MSRHLGRHWPALIYELLQARHKGRIDLQLVLGLFKRRASGKSGRVQTTDLYRRLYEAAGDIKPKNISIDTLSRAFAGNEIDRVDQS
jgi:hypothetical protein